MNAMTSATTATATMAILARLVTPDTLGKDEGGPSQARPRGTARAR
jgi:hypothetical protein